MLKIDLLLAKARLAVEQNAFYARCQRQGLF